MVNLPVTPWAIKQADSPESNAFKYGTRASNFCSGTLPTWIESKYKRRFELVESEKY